MLKKRLIKGQNLKDHRGEIRFFNHFNMGEVVRFYEIVPSDIELIRGWQAHQLEKKWFYCIHGSFIINTVEVDDFSLPSNNLRSEKIVLNSKKHEILYLPGGTATAIKALSNDSRLQIFSNFSLEESKQDDFRYPLNTWASNWNN